MSYNGAGVFSLYTPGNPVVTGTTISSTWANNTLTDIATGLSTAVCKDGQTTITANIPMGGFKVTGLGAGTALTDAIQYQQVQNGAITYLTSVSGTNTITATAPASMAAYATGQEFTFIPAATNTGATTLNINSIGAKNVFFSGAACSGGELKISVPTRVQYDGTQFNIIGPVIGTRITASLSGDVSLNNTANYFDGPSIAQGTSGTWFVTGTVTVQDSNGGGEFLAKLWDGTTVIASARAWQTQVNGSVAMSLSGYITAPAGNLRISVRDDTTTGGVIKFNATGNSKDSTITAIRIA